MSGFSADWLALREPFDTAARARTCDTLRLPALAESWRATMRPGACVKVIDLACGSGANLRALAPRIGGLQKWQMIDHDPALLAALPVAMHQWAELHGHRMTLMDGDSDGDDEGKGKGILNHGSGSGSGSGSSAAWRIHGDDFSLELSTACRDLVRDLDTVDFSQAQLVTASALLDLVSAEWLASLARNVTASGAAMLFALSVDGRTTWAPADAADARVHSLFTQHQRRDKGFGPSLGTDAVRHAGKMLEGIGYSIVQAPSDWRIGADNGAMQAAMVEGMATAAFEQDPQAAALVRQWRARRLAALPTSSLIVGHADLLALPGA